jgi:hypothetical protein
MGMTPGSRATWARGRPAGLAWALWTLVVLSLAVIWRLDHLLR